MKDEWRTPKSILRLVQERSGKPIEWDAACTSENCVAPSGDYRDLGRNGLEGAWASAGALTWCNPPFSDVRPWVVKAIDERHRADSWLLVPCDTSTAWWRMAFDGAQEVVFLTGKVRFVSPDGSPAKDRLRTGIALLRFRSGDWNKIVECVPTPDEAKRGGIV